MLYATYHRLPRPYHFPKHLTLDRLLDSNFDPGLGGFELSLYRREARDLWKGLFGPKGSRSAASRWTMNRELSLGKRRARVFQIFAALYLSLKGKSLRALRAGGVRSGVSHQ